MTAAASPTTEGSFIATILGIELYKFYFYVSRFLNKLLSLYEQMEKQTRFGLVGLLGAPLISSCRVCPAGYTEQRENVCVGEEKSIDVLGTYTLDEVYTLTTSLATTLDAAEACAGFSNVELNEEPGAYDQCTKTYSLFQDNLPVFPQEDTVVTADINSLEVYQMGGFRYSHFTGSAISVVFKNREEKLYLEGSVNIIEEGCHEDLNHYYTTSVCSSSAYEEPAPGPEQGLQLGCTITMDHLWIRPANSFCGFEELVAIKSNVKDFDATELNENLFLLHYDYARALEALIRDVEEE